MTFEVNASKNKVTNQIEYSVRKVRRVYGSERQNISEDEAKIIAKIELSRILNPDLSDLEIREYLNTRIENEDLRKWLLKR